MKYIKLFATGGTFDKEFNEINGDLEFQKTNLYELLELGRCKLDIKIETLMMIDSLKMSDSERNYIVEKCKKENTHKIVITHGTDTMTKTAKLLAKNIKNKTIIFTGAMIPYKFGASDGLFNLGSALTATQTLNNGIYIAINGNIFEWNKVKKNREKGIFELIN